MKRGLYAAKFLPGVACAGVVATAVSASVALAAPTEFEPKPKTLAPVTAPEPEPVVLPAGVRVGGARVGGLTVPAAESAVRRSFAVPIRVVVDGRAFRVSPGRLGKAYVEGAVAKGRAAAPGQSVPLTVTVDGGALRTWAVKIAKRLERRPADAVLRLRERKPVIVPQRYGRTVDRGELVARVSAVLKANDRRPVRIKAKKVAPRSLASGFARVIVIDRSKNVLALYRGQKLWRTFKVATGQAAYPTPRGRFQIVNMWRNPWWYPPASDWAQGLEPVPPGPSNPLGTRWMGLTAPSVGIHGTPQPQSIGYSVSHGCIRMLVPEAEWLYEHVSVGTTVFVL